MISTRTGLLSLAPLLLVLRGTGFSDYGEKATSSGNAGPVVTDESDPTDPTMRILRGTGDAFGVGECPSNVVIELWPPNHKYVDIDLADVLPLTLDIDIMSITQDEPVDDKGDGHTDCDGKGVGTNVAHIRSERSGRNNGRVYVIEYSAFGQGCTGIVTVTVPHDRSGREAVDDGQTFDSSEGCE